MGVCAGVSFEIPLAAQGAPDVGGRDSALVFLECVCQYRNSATVEKVDDRISDSIPPRPKLEEPVLKEVSRRPTESVPILAESLDDGHALLEAIRIRFQETLQPVQRWTVARLLLEKTNLGGRHARPASISPSCDMRQESFRQQLSRKGLPAARSPSRARGQGEPEPILRLALPQEPRSLEPEAQVVTGSSPAARIAPATSSRERPSRIVNCAAAPAWLA